MGWSRRFLHSLSLLPALAGALLLPQPGLADAWSVSRGNPAATGSNNIDTSAAQLANVISHDIGTFADGCGPVVGSDGKVVLANEQGKVMVTGGGVFGWERQLNSGFTVKSTPAISSNGNIYVLSSRKYTDHRVSPAVQRVDVEINGFSSGGGYLFRFPVPAQSGGAIATAPLNIMRAPDGAELIVFPIRYRPPASTATIVHLYAYTLTGSLAAQVPVSSLVTPIEGGMSGASGGGPSPPAPLDLGGGRSEPISLPVPGVAVRPDDPTVVVLNDGISKIVSYRFDGATFQELWRADRSDALSAPAIKGSETAFFNGGAHYLGFNAVGQVNKAGDMAGAHAPPTVVPTGAVVFINRYRRMIVAAGGQYDIGGDSIAPAVASRNFIYISSVRGLVSYRASDFKFVSIYDWPNGDRGGRSEPVIGPDGFIYALAGNKLYTFYPNTGPVSRDNVATGGVVGGDVGGIDEGSQGQGGNAIVNPGYSKMPEASADGGGGGNAFQVGPVVTLNGTQPATETPEPPQEAALPNSQKFDPPLTGIGNPLSACVDSDFKDCGKAAARAFCESKGFTKASDIDIDTKKVQAETLGGAICTAKKCKVVDKVTCSR